MAKQKWVSIYGIAIKLNYFKAMAKIRWHPEKARYYKGWLTRYRQKAVEKRYEIKGTGKTIKETVAKAIKTPPKTKYAKAKKPEQVEEKKAVDEVWLRKKTLHTD